MARPPKKISEFDRKLGAAIKHRRVDPDIDLTQAQLAAASGVPLSNLQRREDGINEVTVSELERIAAALDTTSAAIVEDALKRYGGLDKLIAEFAPVSDPARNVTDLAAKKLAKDKAMMGDDLDEEQERSAANHDSENDQPEPEAP